MVRVLYVDDDADVGACVVSLLAGSGMSVVMAADGLEAVQCLKGGAFDAVVSDYRMPRMNGLELLAHVRSHYAQLPFFLVTGCTDITAAVATGATAVFHKPCDFHRLIEGLIQCEVGGVAAATGVQY